MYSSFVSLGEFISRYFILFVAMVNGVDSLISLSDFSFYYIRIQVISVYYFLYPVIFLNSLTISSNVLRVFLWFTMYQISSIQ